ncbi:glycosyltransferase family 2 protein [Marinobacter nauticus]
MFRYAHSIVIPVYGNEKNIPDLIPALARLLEELPGENEVVFVVDGSPDRSHQLLQEALEQGPFNARLVSHSRNFGAFAAVRTGCAVAEGEMIGAMAADLQEPPELLLQCFGLLRDDEVDVCFGQRTQRHDGVVRSGLSNLFWGVIRRFVEPDMPPGGVDIFACNQKVRKALLTIEEHNSSLISQLFWVGFRRRFVPYERKERQHGKSAWSFRRRFKYMLDSIFSYSDFPVMALLWIGFIGVLLSIVVSLVILIAWQMGRITVPGYTPIMLSIFMVGSLQYLAFGILGCYLWRTLENTKKRPLTIVNNEQEYSQKD